MSSLVNWALRWKCGLPFLAALLLASSAGGLERPHVLLIVSDDLGWNDVGYHNDLIQTPHIDRLAQRGVELDRFYAFPACTPTRVALMTGRSPLALGADAPLGPAGGLPTDERLLPEVLRDAGYQTALIGKWHLGAEHVKYWPTSRGFEHFYGFLNGQIGYWDKLFFGAYDWQRDGKTVREDGHATELIADEAIRLLRNRDSERPLFLEVSFNAPHVPYEVDDESAAASWPFQNPLRRVHVALVEQMDSAIGRILEALDQEEMAKDTLILFISDNGGAVPEIFRSWVRALISGVDELASDNAPLRGGKSDVFEGGIRVPAIMVWPGVIEAGRVIKHRVTVQDVLPTLAEALGVPLDPTIELHGVSRWDVLAHGADTPAPDFAVGSMGAVAYFRGAWKLVHADTPIPFAKVDTGTFLFKIDEDPYERRDLYELRPDKAAELEAALAEFPALETVFERPSPLLLMRMDSKEETGVAWAEAAARD